MKRHNNKQNAVQSDNNSTINADIAENNIPLVADKKTNRRNIIMLVLAGVILFITLFFALFISPIKVDGASMAPTLADGSTVFINRVDKKVEHGDIVVYVKPDEKDKVIKRIVGLPGDTMKVEPSGGSFSLYRLGEDGVYVKVAPISKEQYNALKPDTASNGEAFTFKISEDHFFAVGDNYEISLDSRLYGQVPLDNIKGVVIGDFPPPSNLNNQVVYPNV